VIAPRPVIAPRVIPVRPVFRPIFIP
jgi:hypothetical protein